MIANEALRLFVLFLSCFAAVQTRAEEFSPGCDLPFAPIAEKRPIDDKCGLDGSGTDPPKVAESRQKNFFCAEGEPKTVTFKTFERLQRAAEQEGISFGSASKLPQDRASLKDIVSLGSDKAGEGTPVRFVAFLKEAHFSNVSKGEAVNCKLGGKENNDIHVVLVSTVDEDDDCNSITAEISPHFRPRVWEKVVSTRIGRPVRVTGALFFDASHKPCGDGKRPSPQRASIWEIHPVYALDVCKAKTKKACPASSASIWIPFHEWVNLKEEHEDE